MSEVSARGDVDRVGLSERSKFVLDEMVSDGHFKDALSGYRMAISFAIYKNIEFIQHSVNRPGGHMYLISQLDPDGCLGLLIDEIHPQLSSEKYRSLEKLADLGLPKLRDYLATSGSIVFWEE